MSKMSGFPVLHVVVGNWMDYVMCHSMSWCKSHTGTSIRNVLLACNGKDRRSLTNLQSKGRSRSYGKVFLRGLQVIKVT